MDKYEQKKIDDERRKEIGRRIREERKRTKNPDFLNGRCYSQELFAEKLHISKQAYNNLENGVGEPKLEYLYRIKELCGCDIGYLVGEYDCRTKEATDINQVTGLSEESINVLLDEPFIGFYDGLIKKSYNAPDSLYMEFIELENLKIVESIFEDCFSEEAKKIFYKAYKKTRNCEVLGLGLSFYDDSEKYRDVLKEIVCNMENNKFDIMVNSCFSGGDKECFALNITPNYKEFLAAFSNTKDAFVLCFSSQTFQYFQGIYLHRPLLEYKMQHQFIDIIHSMLGEE